MNLKERELLVKTWIEHNRETHIDGKTAKEGFWAWRALYEATIDNPELSWELILQILATDQSDETYVSLAAGHLEDLLVYHSKDFIDRVEEKAKDESSFNHLLGGVWRNNIDIDVWRRIEKIRKRVW